MKRQILRAGFGAVGRVLLLGLLFDGLFQLVQNVELLELRVRAHANLN